MAHNQKLLEAHGAEWEGKVRIIGVSIDQTADAVVKHVKAKGWEKVEHYHKHGSSADEDYGVTGVPHIVIIDGKGKIAYAGHPASRNVEEDLKTLAKGDSLKGVSSGGDDEEEDDGSAFKDTELSEVSKECERYESEISSKLLQNTTLINEAASLMRDFVVLVRETYYDVSKKKFMSKLENINVLVGPKESVQAAKTQVEKFIGEFKGSFKTNWRIQEV